MAASFGIGTRDEAELHHGPREAAQLRGAGVDVAENEERTKRRGSQPEQVTHREAVSFNALARNLRRAQRGAEAREAR
jgi:hypothetical protein